MRRVEGADEALADGVEIGKAEVAARDRRPARPRRGARSGARRLWAIRSGSPWKTRDTSRSTLTKPGRPNFGSFGK